jgi:uncharacterized membrane protein YphA (DoxX/SURF4 family)
LTGNNAGLIFLPSSVPRQVSPVVKLIQMMDTKNMKAKLTIALIIVTIICGIILVIAGLNPLIALVGGGIVWFMIYFMWSPPRQHKEFTDADRLKATRRAMGGSGPPELWIPPMPEIKHKKHHKKKVNQ